MVSLRLEVLEARVAAAALEYAFDVFDPFGQVVGPGLTDGVVVEGDALEVVLMGRAVYGDDEALPPRGRGVFAFGVDLVYNAQWLTFVDARPDGRFSNVFHAVDELVDEFTRQVDDLGGALSAFDESGIFQSGEDWVDLAVVEFLVEDNARVPGTLTGLGLDVADVDAFYASLVFGVDGAVADPLVAPGEELQLIEVRRLPVLQNEALPADVNGDGQLAPLDVLAVVNDVVEFGPRTVRDAVVAETVPAELVDVNGDGRIGQVADAFAVLGAVNQAAPGS